MHASRQCHQNTPMTPSSRPQSARKSELNSQSSNRRNAERHNQARSQICQDRLDAGGEVPSVNKVKGEARELAVKTL